jgi:hypothetical protein
LVPCPRPEAHPHPAIKIAMALSQAFNRGVRVLPLLPSWYEQKAVAILLTLLHPGIRNLRLGPTLPAFVTPNVWFAEKAVGSLILDEIELQLPPNRK